MSTATGEKGLGDWLATHGYTEEEGRLFYEQLLDRVRAEPGVESASLGRFALLRGANASNRGRAVDGGEDAPEVNIPYNVVDPEYFRTNRMELVAGRFFTPSDAEDTPYVAVVNKQAELMIRLGAELGLSPSSRTRLNAEALSSKPDEFDEYLRGRPSPRQDGFDNLLESRCLQPLSPLFGTAS